MTAPVSETRKKHGWAWVCTRVTSQTQIHLISCYVTKKDAFNLSNVLYLTYSVSSNIHFQLYSYLIFTVSKLYFSCRTQLCSIITLMYTNIHFRLCRYFIFDEERTVFLILYIFNRIC